MNHCRRLHCGAASCGSHAVLHSCKFAAPFLYVVRDSYVHGHSQAFEITVRPAVDSFDSLLDRVKMSIYTNFAAWGLPCPITGQEAVIGAEALKKASSTDA